MQSGPRTPWTWLPLLLVVNAGASPAQPGWTSVAQGGRVARGFAAAADVDRGVVVGLGSLGPACCQTWLWDGQAWAVRNLFPRPNSGLTASAMAYDRARRRTVVFDSSGRTWTFDGVGWTEHFPSSAPSQRSGTSMVYDSRRQRIVLFGGYDYQLVRETKADTWEWDGSDWQQRFPTTSPPPITDHAMAYDASRGVTVVFGGVNDNGFVEGTWEWDGFDWLRRAPRHEPPTRQIARMAADPVRGRLVLFGGVRVADAPLDDTWEWDGIDWVRIPGPAPGGRSSHVVVWDPTRQQILVAFGIGPNFLSRDDTWAYDPPTVVGSVGGFGTGCGIGGLVPHLATPPAELPWLGSSFTLELTRLPDAGQVGLVVGSSHTQWGAEPLPLSLSPLGFGSCTLYVSPDSVLPLTAAAGTARAVLPIPASTALLALPLYAQGFAVDTAGTVVWSNATIAVVGG